MRFEELTPDVLHWLGIRRIERFVSMSNMKYEAIARQGIEIVRQVPIPDELVPDDANVEIDAKKAAGYFTEVPVVESDLAAPEAGQCLSHSRDSPSPCLRPADARGHVTTFTCRSATSADKGFLPPLRRKKRGAHGRP